MVNASWFVHIRDGVVGPFSSEDLVLMLNGNRFQFSDFVWKEGLKSWCRISEFGVFSVHIPGEPKTALPISGKKISEVPKTVEAPKVAEVAKEVEAVKTVEAPKKQIVDTELRFVRVPLDGKITIKGGKPLSIVNFAIGGILVSADEMLPVGTEIQFTLESSVFEKTLDLTGVIVRYARAGEKSGFAIEFLRINPAYKRLFETYVRNWKEN